MFSNMLSKVTGLFRARGDRPYKMLVIGQTGSGKTSFLNLLCNLPAFLTIAADASTLEGKSLQDYHNLTAENAVQSEMQSKTSECTAYAVGDLGFPLTIIDTPGFGDSRGLQVDKEHASKIVQVLKDEEYVNCIVLVVNGRESRMNPTVAYVLSEITSIMPRAVLDSIIVVATNTNDVLDLNFKVSALEPFFGKPFSEDHLFLVENPYCKVKKALQQKPELERKTMQSVKRGFSETADTLSELFETIAQYPQVATHEFEQLYQAKQRIQTESARLLQEFQNAVQNEGALTDIIRGLEDAQTRADSNRNFVSHTRRWVNKETAGHNMICGYANCGSNCHISCQMEKSFNKEVYKRCCAFFYTSKRCQLKSQADVDFICGICDERSESFYVTADGGASQTQRVLRAQRGFSLNGVWVDGNAALQGCNSLQALRGSLRLGSSVTFLDNSDQATCNECGHHYTDHFHSNTLWEPVVDEQVNELMKQAHAAAILDAEQKRQLRAAAEDQLVASRAAQKQATAALLENIKQIEQLGLARNYMFVLQNQKRFVQQHLELARGNDASSGAEQLETALAEVERMIAAVEKARA